VSAYNSEADDRDVPPPITRKRKRKSGGYRYYLEDHPVLGPIITLVLGSLCVYSTIFTHLLADFMIGPDADRTMRDNFATLMSWGVAFVLGLMGISLIFLIWHVAEIGLRRARRRAAVCPRCGTAEIPKSLDFAHERVEGTAWETITCPKCGNTWHARP
jgi:hypothetical protein